jgi:hypothetical protein
MDQMRQDAALRAEQLNQLEQERQDKKLND